MKKHLLLLIWIIIFFGIAVNIALVSVLFGRPDYYDIIITVEAIIFFLFIPLIIIDLKLSSRQKIENKMQEKNFELFKKQAEIEELKRQRELITEDKRILIHAEKNKSKQKYCTFCGEIITQDLIICPHCGKDLKH